MVGKEITKNYIFPMGPETIRENLVKASSLRNILTQAKNREEFVKRLSNSPEGEVYEIYGAIASFGLGDIYVKITGDFKSIEKARKYLERKVDLIFEEIKEE